MGLLGDVSRRSRITSMACEYGSVKNDRSMILLFATRFAAQERISGLSVINKISKPGGIG